MDSSTNDPSASPLTENVPGPRGLRPISGPGPGAGPHQLLRFHLGMSGGDRTWGDWRGPVTWGCAHLLVSISPSLGPSAPWSGQHLEEQGAVDWSSSPCSPTTCSSKTGPGLSLSSPSVRE